MICGLPKIPSVVYDLTIPGTGEVIKFRPMLVKEYKALLQSQELGDDTGFINTIRGIIDDCLLNKVDIDDLPMYAIDYIFLRIRAKSIGETVSAEYKCNAIADKLTDYDENGVAHSSEKAPCGKKFLVQFNLEDAFVKFPVDYHKKCIIQLTDDVGIRLKAPTFRRFRSVGLEGKGTLDITDEYVFACVDSIFDGEKVITPSEFTLDELREFIESFPADKINEITEFFQNQPKVTLVMTLTCPACGHQATIELNGLKDFFD